MLVTRSLQVTRSLARAQSATAAVTTATTSITSRPRSTAAATAIDTQQCTSEWAAAKPYHEIPGPKPYPIVGNVVRFLPNISEYGKLDLLRMHLRLQKQYGDIVRVSKVLGRKDMIFVFDPKIVEKMFRNEGIWPKREGIKTMHYYRTVMRKERYGDIIGTVTSQGKVWQDFRSKVNQPLMQPASARRYTAPINEVADDFMERIRVLRDDKKELPANFINELYKWSLESIALVALDKRLGCLAPDLAPDSEPQRMIDAVQVMFDAFYHLDLRPSLWRIVSTPLWRKYVASMDYFYDVADKYVKEAVERSKANHSREPSILERLMQEDPKVANVMASDMLFGGVDTTSHLVASFLLHLAFTPDVQIKLAEEIRRVLPNTDSPVTAEALTQMTYLKACLKESLRAFPITIGNIREPQSDVVLGGYQVPKGVDVFLCHMAMSRDERNYPRPLSFEPERWFRGSSEAHDAHPFVTLPFGFGPRTCVGRRFAEMEVLTLVAKVIRNFWVEYHYGNVIEFQSRSINTVINPLKIRLLEHQN